MIGIRLSYPQFLLHSFTSSLTFVVLEGLCMAPVLPY